MSFFLLNSSSSSSSSSSESSSDDEVVAPRITNPIRKIKIKNYVEEVALKYLPEDFRSHFRLNRSTIEMLICNIKVHDVPCLGRASVPILHATLATIWVLANQESLRSTGDRFGFSKGHLHAIYLAVCKKINAHIAKYIEWPTGVKAIENIRAFNNLRGENSFPNVFGCVDGSHIPIPGPLNDNSYYNRKGFHSVILQGICNSKLEFINIFVGWPGSSHDARVWTNSLIYNKLKTERSAWLPEGSYLLGDTAYPVDTFCIVPYKDNGHLSAKHHQFNKKLSSSRVVIEQAYGRLKGMFRKLKYVNVYNIENVKEVVMACCILHNLAIRDGTNYDVDEDEDVEPPQLPSATSVEDCPVGTRFRDYLLNSLTY